MRPRSKDSSSPPQPRSMEIVRLFPSQRETRESLYRLMLSASLSEKSIASFSINSMDSKPCAFATSMFLALAKIRFRHTPQLSPFSSTRFYQKRDLKFLATASSPEISFLWLIEEKLTSGGVGGGQR